MALQGSGTIRASQINTELGRTSTANISLDSAENGSYVTINSCSPSKPNASNPAAMSEWYSYNHTYACCYSPSITQISNITSSSVDIYWVGTGNCTAAHIEYSTNQVNWSTTTGGCTSPRTVSGLSSSTTYYFRIRITCTSTGGYSGYSNTMSATTSGSCPAYGTYLSQYCSGCTLYYRYANGSCGTYDVSQGCSTACGGCCCAPAYGTYLYDGCSGCDYYYYYADGCYGSYATLIESNSANCGCGGGKKCYVLYSMGGPFRFTDCYGNIRSGKALDFGEYLGCGDPDSGYGYEHYGEECLPF